MEYQVKIDEFEGPLDLLLFLIKETKISIDKISVTQITAQYLNYIHEMEVLNLEVASEYLVMAAYLVFIKSKMMLPKANIEAENLGYEENPEEKLKMRLRIYKLFKDMIPTLQSLEEERTYFLNKMPTDLSNEFKLDNKEVLEQNMTVYDLLSAFNKTMRRFMLHKPLKTKIMGQGVTIDDRIVEVREFIASKKNITFDELIEENTSREYIVVTFMAILELAKEKYLSIKQDELFEEIHLNYIEGRDTDE